MGRFLERFEVIYPGFKKAPESLKQRMDLVFERADENVCFLCGDMAFDNTQWTPLKNWFKGQPDIANEIFVFGCDGNSGLYGFWIHDGAPLEKAPIVYLDDAGRDSYPIANSLDEFLALVALGKNNRLGRYKLWDQSKTENEGLAEYRSWLRDVMKIEPVTDDKTGAALIENARKSHPDLNKWIDEWMAKHPG
jgi:hypothetical protein